MRPAARRVLFVLAVFLLFPAGILAQEPAATTYTVTIQADGTALWQVEYRTLLSKEDDLAAFGNYTRDLTMVYIPQVQELMQRSAATAAVAASRPMAVSNVTGTAVVQTSPTGRYGVVVYTFSWSGFARPDGTITVGDAFAGGLYLAKDNALVLRYPAGWSAARAEPAPDLQRDGLIWYGLRSFSPGEPRVLLEHTAFPMIPAIIVLIFISLAGAGYMVYQKRRADEAPDERMEPEEPAVPLSEADAASLEERIIALLNAGGGEQHQSGIVKTLGIPKSTVSSALNSLHAKGMIVKVRKGRENIIRLVNRQNPD